MVSLGIPQRGFPASLQELRAKEAGSVIWAGVNRALLAATVPAHLSSAQSMMVATSSHTPKAVSFREFSCQASAQEGQ